MNWRPILNQRPNLADFFIVYGDAAFGPIFVFMDILDPFFAVGQAVDHDQAAGVLAEPFGLFPVFSVGV